MAKTLELALVHSTGTFVFAVEGDYFPRWEPSYRFNAPVPVVVEMRYSWEFRQVKLIAASPAALWTGAGATIATLNGLLSARGSTFPTSATLKTPGGTTLTEFGAGYEQFIIEALEGEPDAETPRASWATSAAFTLRISAVKRNADTTTGIVDFQQAVRVSYPGGLHRVVVETLVTTREGTSARTKAATYAALDATAYGSDYLYETGVGADGIDYDEEDADIPGSRTATVCRAVSIIQQKGVDVGTTGPTGSLSDASYSVDTQRTAKEVIVTTTAEAIGANAMAWVLSLKPAGSLFDSRIFEEPSSLLVRGTWVKKTPKATSDGTSTETQVDITGGGRALAYEPVAGGFEPLEFEGAYLPWTARVTVSVERVGGDGRLSELRLPGPPGDPWRFDQNASTEQDPYRVRAEKGTDEGQDKWRREAVLVFRSVRPPDGPVALAMASVPSVSTYFYPQAS